MKEVMNFEEAMQKLELIVKKLEGGEVPLEEAISLFQDGMQLSHLCNSKLEEVERKIEMLIDENGELTKKPFEPSTSLKGEE